MNHPHILHHGAISGVTGSCLQLQVDAGHAPLLPAPKPPYRADILVVESSCGDSLHEDIRTRRERLEGVIEQALANNGSVLIPVFTIGCPQKLLYELEEIIHSKKIDAISKGQGSRAAVNPLLLSGSAVGVSGGSKGKASNIDQIGIDSPLVNLFTWVYRELKPLSVNEVLQRVKQGRDLLGFEQLQGTPGRVIQLSGERGGYVNLGRERSKIGAKINTIGGYLCHANQKGMLGFVTRMRDWPNQMRIVHSETGAKHEHGERPKVLNKQAQGINPRLQKQLIAARS